MADEHKVELVLLALAILALGARPAPVDASELRAGVPAEIFVAPGRATTIQLQTEEKIAAISLASPIVAYKYDRSLNQLEITPTVRSGGVETNLNLRIGPDGRAVKVGAQVEIGGNDRYVAVCRRHFNEALNSV